MYLVVFAKRADADKRLLKDAGLERSVRALLDLLSVDPLKYPPPFEKLVGNLDGYYSRRINIKHRLVYEIISEPVERDGAEYEGIVKVYRMWSHYGD